MPLGRGVAWARFRVTVVAIAALAIIAVLVYLLTGGTLLTEKVTLYLYIPDATGLESDSPVRVNGIGVGKVDRVELSGSSVPNRVVRLTLKIENEKLADIPTDSTAQITIEGNVGNQFVAITQGTAATRIRPNAEITYRAAPELLKTLDVQSFAKQLRDVDATLTDIEQGKGLVGQFVVGTEMYDDLRRGLADIDRSFKAAVSVTSETGRFLRTDEMYRRIRDPVIELDDRLSRIQAGQGELGRLLREDGQYNELRDQAASLRKSIADVRAAPFLTSDDLYTSWNQGLASLTARIDQFDASPMLRNSMAYDNLSGSLHELQTSLHDFRQDPKKFLRIKLF
ncbi:MAG TPA: MlaD family protein [Bryobacteraceae bacterium]|nr:MlaD family protein [Bryobacteraceae bacterium]